MNARDANTRETPAVNAKPRLPGDKTAPTACWGRAGRHPLKKRQHILLNTVFKVFSFFQMDFFHQPLVEKYLGGSNFS